MMRWFNLLFVFVVLVGSSLAQLQESRSPNILVISIDTVRLDHLSSFGYARPTSPNIDALLAEGARFEQLRVVEPLTAPSLTSTLTSLYPHEHGATRNGIPVRIELESLPNALNRERDYTTAAYVGNWTLKPNLSGLQEYFQTYEVVTSRKRWFGLFKSEATAQDLNDEAIAWLDRHVETQASPFFMWVHYVEPHAPYRYWEEYADRLGIPSKDRKLDRYDTEIAYVDAQMGELLKQVRQRVDEHNLLIVFTADHGESLGEHGYWGHGRHLFDVNLRVPAGIIWKGRIEPQSIAAPAVNIDLAPTVMGLIHVPPDASFRGYNWAPVIRRETQPPQSRVFRFQAHKGAAQSQNRLDKYRLKGLLEIGLINGSRKEIAHVKDRERRVFDLDVDPGEIKSLTAPSSEPSEELQAWAAMVEAGLDSFEQTGTDNLSEEDLEMLKTLGYLK